MQHKRLTAAQARDFKTRLNYITDAEDRMEMNRLLSLPNNINVYASFLFLDHTLEDLINKGGIERVSKEEADSFRSSILTQSALVGIYGSLQMQDKISAKRKRLNGNMAETSKLVDLALRQIVFYRDRQSKFGSRTTLSEIEK